MRGSVVMTPKGMAVAIPAKGGLGWLIRCVVVFAAQGSRSAGAGAKARPVFARRDAQLFAEDVIHRFRTAIA
jgi:hypothetical protein